LTVNAKMLMRFNIIKTLQQITAYYQVCNKSNTMDATSGVGTPYPPGAPEFITNF